MAALMPEGLEPSLNRMFISSSRSRRFRRLDEPTGSLGPGKNGGALHAVSTVIMILDTSLIGCQKRYLIVST
jgi:hypothetical protein